MTLISGILLHAQALHDVVTGDMVNDFMGWSISGISDLNNDGVDDIIIGAPGFDGMAVDSGLVAIISGKTGGLLFHLPGFGSLQEFGSAVAAVPDTNGDGLEDIAVGAPRYGFGGNSGAVFLFSGDGGMLLAYAMGSHQGAFLGECLASGFDVDGDGKGDVLAGEPGYSHGGAVQCGAVRLLSGDSLSEIFLVHGFTSYDQLGQSLTMVEDVDGDQVPDSVVGIPGYDPTGLPGAGAAVLLSGTTGALLRLFEGPISFGSFGSSVAALPDVSGDGYPEILTGGPTATANNHSNAGIVLCYSGDNPVPVQAWSGNRSNQHFGRSLAPAGLFDTDKFPDIAIGMRRPFNGFDYTGSVRIFSGRDWTFLTDLDPGPSGAQFGGSIAALGDLNNDGWGDLAVGDPYSDAKASQGGETRFHLGSRPYLTLDSTGQLGTPLDLSILGYPADTTLIMMDFTPGPTQTVFGIFDLGFSGSMLFFPLFNIPQSARFEFTFSIPNAPALVGRTLYFQALGYHESAYLISSPDQIEIIQ